MKIIKQCLDRVPSYKKNRKIFEKFLFYPYPSIFGYQCMDGLHIYCAENGYWTRSKVKTEIANKNNLLKINNLKLLIQ
jgi:hypothetical protein